MQDWKTTHVTARTFSEDVQIEVVRKSIHALVALVPAIAHLTSVPFALALLGSGTIFYAAAETARMHGYSVVLVSRLTMLAARPRDLGHFILGPVTLGIGAMAGLLLYPDPAASIAIYALAFGDGIASFAGKLIGSVEVPLTNGKTVEGAIACFVAVFLATYAVVGRSEIAGTVAAAAALVELLPTRDMDNIVLPVGTGLVASYLLL
jgi:dolichol kinase